ncbi:MAG: hypothetical protein IKC03_08120, partial [Oscillospiraceae bacterium]|nr:hypothetical protein [Oscillospiraceae bacterium]
MSKKSLKELAKARKERKEEFINFLNNTPLDIILGKLIGFLTDKEQDIELRVTSGSESYTDGKTITLGLPDFFFAEEYGPEDWILGLKILLIHEIQHINSSNFRDIEIIGEFYAQLMQPYQFPEDFCEEIAGNFLNMMEDPRIECIYTHDLPGYRLPTMLINNMIWQSTGPEKVAKKPRDEFYDFVNNALAYALTGRVAPNMSIYSGSRLESEFAAVADLFDEAVEARTSEMCRTLCEQMLTKTAPYFAELLKEEAEQQKVLKMLQQLLPQRNEYTSNTGTEENLGSGSSGSTGLRVKRTKTELNQNAAGSQQSSQQEAGGGQSSGQETESESADGAVPGTANKRKRKKPLDKDKKIDRSGNWTGIFSEPETAAAPTPISEDELRQIRQGIRDEVNAANIAPIQTTAVEQKQGISYYSGKVHFEETFPQLKMNDVPADLMMQATRLERSIEQVLRHKRAERRNTRSGRLDTRRLYRYGLRDPHLFMRKGQPMEADMAVYLLMDNSGSMDSCGAEMNGTTYSKSKLSRVAASVIELAMCQFAALKITLFDSCGKVCHVTLKQFDEQTKGQKESRCYSSIDQIGTGCGNKDGFSIRVATKDLMDRREAKKVLLILSDG